MYSYKTKVPLFIVCKILEEEKKSHEDLRQTWQMANDQFLESQRLMMMDLRRMESVLTVEQQRQIGGKVKVFRVRLRMRLWYCIAG